MYIFRANKDLHVATRNLLQRSRVQFGDEHVEGVFLLARENSGHMLGNDGWYDDMRNVDGTPLWMMIKMMMKTMTLMLTMTTMIVMVWWKP
jgi:hypothetical protein